MNPTIITRLWRYCKSISIIVALVLVLAQGPCGGWIFGFIAALFLGFVATATIWLLEFKWYWNFACGLIISIISLSIFIPATKQISQIVLNETLSSSIDCLFAIALFLVLIEITNYLGMRIHKSTRSNKIEGD